MKLIPSRTRIMEPPHTDIYKVLNESIHDLKERDVVVITSKVIAISEGRYIRMNEVDKEVLVKQEAEYIYEEKNRKTLTLVHNALISAAGIDESNGFGHYILLPKDPFASARRLHTYLCTRYKLEELGVVITDSHSLPLRYGAMSISIGCWGFEPVENHVGRQDLFGRVMKYSKLDVADSVAASCALVSGECDERTPVVVVRDIPNLVFTDASPKEKLFVSMEDDIYQPLLRGFKKTDAQA